MAKELFDQGEPRSNVILIVAIGIIVTLFFAAVGFTSYFLASTAQNEANLLSGRVIGDETATEQNRLNPLGWRNAEEARQEAQLNAGRVGIARAMQAYGGQGRNASAAIMARQSGDAVEGWERLHDQEDVTAAGPGDESASAASAGDAVAAGDTPEEAGQDADEAETPQDVTDAEEEAQAEAEEATDSAGQDDAAEEAEES